MRDRAYADDLIVGQKYIESNSWHPECEYGEIWYVGTSYNKYGELIHCFSDKEIEFPEGYDGNADNISFGGPVYTETEIDDGNVALA